MRKIIIVCGLIFFFGCTGFSQTVNGIQLKDIKAEYLQITQSPVTGNQTEIYLLINYGQPIDPIGNMEKLLLDNKGTRMKFNSIIDALNFMNDKGYELAQNYETKIGSYLMRKKK